MANALIEKYKKLFFDLLPQGKAWSRESGTVLSQLIEGMGLEFSRVESRGLFLTTDVDPYRTTELLDSWENLLGLPDDCATGTQTLVQRQNAIIAQLSLLGGQSAQFLIDVAFKLGFVITITEYRPFEVGRSRVGDPLTNGEWVFHFTVNGVADASLAFIVGRSRVGEPLGSFGTGVLECTIDRLKPANTTVNFVYGV